MKTLIYLRDFDVSLDVHCSGRLSVVVTFCYEFSNLEKEYLTALLCCMSLLKFGLCLLLGRFHCSA